MEQSSGKGNLQLSTEIFWKKPSGRILLIICGATADGNGRITKAIETDGLIAQLHQLVKLMRRVKNGQRGKKCID